MWQGPQPLPSFGRSTMPQDTSRNFTLSDRYIGRPYKSVSIRFGYSIGGFDADKIVGDALVLGIGKAGEPYEGIGRGELNIEGMPVYRDAVGGIRTPTSDNERTKLELGTTHLLTIINGYSGKEGLRDAADYMIELLKEFASAEDIKQIEF